LAGKSEMRKEKHVYNEIKPTYAKKFTSKGTL
jgi:hypothetical protein